MKNFLTKLLMFLLVVTTTFSEIFINVDNPKPSVNQSFNIQVSFVDEEKTANIIGLENFIILSKSSSSNYSNINGKVTSRENDNYLLKPKGVGTFTIRVPQKDKTFEEAIITVTDKPTASPNTPTNYILEATVGKDEYYFGEKIPYEENLIATQTISGMRAISNSNFGNLSFKNITRFNGRGGFLQNITTYDGKRALELSVFRGILESTFSGDVTITSSEFQIEEASSNFFQPKTVFVGNEKINITIKNLPVEGRPAIFYDIVGKITSNNNWKIDSPTVGKAITLTVNLYGDGNLELLNELPIKQSNQFNFFQTPGEYVEDIKDGKYYNRKSFDIAIIPKVQGVLKTPEIVIPYFNTETEKYDNLIIPSRQINVARNPVTSDIVENQSGLNTTQNNQNTNENISPPIEENISFSALKVEDIPKKNPFKLIAFVLGILLIIETILLIFMFMKRKKK